MIYSIDSIQWPLVQAYRVNPRQMCKDYCNCPTIVSAPSAESKGQHWAGLLGFLRLPLQLQLKTPVNLDSASSGVRRGRQKQIGHSRHNEEDILCILDRLYGMPQWMMIYTEMRSFKSWRHEKPRSSDFGILSESCTLNWSSITSWQSDLVGWLSVPVHNPPPCVITQ